MKLTVKAAERNCKAVKAFADQRRKANGRGVEFAMDFATWQWLWLASGKWDQRGNRRGDYVMARFGDKGPYAVGNVFFQTVAANAIEGQLKHPRRGGHYPRKKCPRCTRKVPINILWRHLSSAHTEG